VRIRFEPTRQFDVGAGYGKVWDGMVKGGIVGVVIDARGRPLKLSDDEDKRMQQLRKWLTAMDCI
jgi:hypothetical protein